MVTLRAPLTPRQVAVLRVVTASISERGYAPSFTEIATALGYKSLSTVHEHLRTLEAKGYLRREYNEARAITLLVDASQPGEVTP